jgi:transposase-like protein
MNRKQERRQEQWRQRIAQQEASTQTIRGFCRERGINEQTFYGWRHRLRVRNQPVTFALVDTRPAPPLASSQPIEFVLGSGDRMRIAADAATLRLVLNVLRETAA